MSGLPRTSGRNTTGKCTGDWAGHTLSDDRHCVCWWDSTSPTACCQCEQVGDDCSTCHNHGILTVQTGGPDQFGNYDTDEIPCPTCQPTWVDRDDYEQSRADHHREMENEQ